MAQDSCASTSDVNGHQVKPASSILYLRLRVNSSTGPGVYVYGPGRIISTEQKKKIGKKFREFQILAVVALDQRVGTKTLLIEIYVTRP